jgi:hypothetical protein
VILAAQLHKLRSDTVASLKAQGVEYEERMAELDKLEHPKPLRDFTYDLFNHYLTVHPWAADHTIRPKSVARELYERAMTFTEYIHHYGLARSEGLLLRYLSDAYKGLMQTVPEDAKTEEVFDLTEWLGETVRQVDSSLLDEWDQLRHPDDIAAVAEGSAVPLSGRGPGGVHGPGIGGEAGGAGEPVGVTPNARAFKVMVRNELFRWVELLSRRASDELVERLPASASWKVEGLAEALAPYWDEHEVVGIDTSARSGELFRLDEEASPWTAIQVLADPEGNHDWTISAVVDPEASDEEARAVLSLVSVTRST